MADLFKTLEDHATGVWLFIILVFSALIAIGWLARIFGFGRFSVAWRTHKPTKKNADGSDPSTNDTSTPVTAAAVSSSGDGVFTAFLYKLITEFRHALALVIVFIFAGALIYAMYAGRCDMDKLKEALAAVTSTLGGLVGSIIGYYFGESKGQNSGLANQPPLGTTGTSVPPTGVPSKPTGTAGSGQPADTAPIQPVTPPEGII